MVSELKLSLVIWSAAEYRWLARLPPYVVQVAFRLAQRVLKDFLLFALALPVRFV